jgi:hypothetical protein
MAGGLVIATDRRAKDITPFQMHWGSSVPSNAIGNDGDVYFRNNNGAEMFYKKNSGVWSAPAGSVDLSSVTKEPTGFVDPTLVTINYDSAARTITLTGTYRVFYHGSESGDFSNGWVSTAHGTANGVWFLWYDNTGFVWSQSPWTLDVVMIAAVNYGVTDKYALSEKHGLLQWQAHFECHYNIGTWLLSGGDLAGYTAGSTTLKNPTISAATIYDEDNKTVNPALTNSLYTKFYLTGSGATATYAVNTASIVPVSGNQPYYNQNNAGTWQQTLMTTNAYQALFLMAVPTTSDAGSQGYRFMWVQGQTQSTTLATIQALTTLDLTLGTLGNELPEFVFIAKVIIRYTGGNWSITSAQKLTGSRISQTGATAGNYLSSVVTDATLTGTGTAADPLHVVAPTVFLGWDGTNSQTFNLVVNTNSTIVTNFTITSGSKLRVERDGVTIYEGYGWTRNTGTNSIDFSNQILADSTSPVLVFVGRYS